MIPIPDPQPPLNMPVLPSTSVNVNRKGRVGEPNKVYIPKNQIVSIQTCPNSQSWLVEGTPLPARLGNYLHFQAMLSVSRQQTSTTRSSIGSI
jgi:hypothetical protein